MIKRYVCKGLTEKEKASICLNCPLKMCNEDRGTTTNACKRYTEELKKLRQLRKRG